MEKDLTLTELYDIYGVLLTKRQRELFEGYYLYDLSLSEISAPDGKSRQSVYEGVKKVKNKLIEYEKLLKIKSKETALTEFANNVGDKVVGDKIIEILQNNK